MASRKKLRGFKSLTFRLVVRFHIGTILSVTSGYLLDPNGFRGLNNFLDYMTGYRLFTNQLPRAVDVVAEVLLKRFPYLATIEVPDFTKELNIEARKRNINNWLSVQAEMFGNTLEVSPLPSNTFEMRNPIEELCEQQKMNTKTIPTIPELKDVIGEGKYVSFLRLEGADLWYRCDNGFEFSVPLHDTSGAVFNARDKSIFFMRWIRRQIDFWRETEKAKAENITNE